MTQYAYLVVEGPHDVEFVGRFLKLKGFSRVQDKRKLDKFWEPLVPKTFPYKNDLLRRVPVPTFFKSATHSIALHNATGDTNIINTIEETREVISWEGLVGLGIVLDADSKVSPKERFDNIKEGLQKRDIISELPESPGKILQGKPHCGIFIMPDNCSAGTLEDLLLECAELVYSPLLEYTKTFLDCVKPVVTQFEKEKERKDFEKQAGDKKVMVGCIANVLRPGKAVQVSIQDNRWITEETVRLPSLAHFDTFLQDLFALSTSST
ncbi:MAG: hypothetical protein DRR16_02325 [Candidatus Parabeggiatoa sp. nov. 3]|nr:MAG: hypothetical protein DRR00_14445 [Gammaproteobacteria bacterium]RKZ67022.1 MAG: hypothetical protein DRQ99_07885 [Gammaproteobacteria bacterium]RKZ89507.1 MAG: hypothetical protein DRR16_02325 [Gammaproteobacteria bacterium]